MLKHPIFMLLLCCFTVANAHAASAVESTVADPVQPSAARPVTYKATMDVVYGHRAGMALVYHVLEPAVPNGAAVIFLNSGSWISPYVPFKNDQASLGMFGAMLAAGYTVY